MAQRLAWALALASYELDGRELALERQRMQTVLTANEMGYTVAATWWAAGPDGVEPALYVLRAQLGAFGAQSAALFVHGDLWRPAVESLADDFRLLLYWVDAAGRVIDPPGEADPPL